MKGPRQGPSTTTANTGTSAQNGSSGVDDATRQYLMGIMGQAGQAAAAGPGSALTGASDYYTKMMQGGQQGAAALGGDVDATKSLMNPYTDQVINKNAGLWNTINKQTEMGQDDAATKAGAFGGSRHGVATGVALAQNNGTQGAQNAELLRSGFTDAMGRAAGMRDAGMAGAGANSQLGAMGVGNPNLWAMNMLKQGFMGPLGQSFTNNQNSSSTSKETKYSAPTGMGDIFGGLLSLGGGLMGGGGLTGLLGSLGGMFGGK